MERIVIKLLDNVTLTALITDQTGNLSVILNGQPLSLGKPILRKEGSDIFVLLLGEKKIEIEVPDWKENGVLDNIVKKFNEIIRETLQS